MNPWARAWPLLRAAMAVAILVAIIGQAIVTIGGAVAAERDVSTTIANFFSFFTILSNVAAVVVLLWAAIWSWTRHPDASPIEPRTLALALASVSTYMIITGVVYNLLLRVIALPQGATLPWSNEILHLIGPLFLLVDLLVAPRRRALGWGAIWAVLVFPATWIVYTMIRAGIVTDPVTSLPYWYPYPFLNPNPPGSMGSVVAYVIGVSLAFGAVSAFAIYVGRRRAVAGAVVAAGRGIPVQ